MSKAFCSAHYQPWHKCKICGGDWNDVAPVTLDPKVFWWPSRYITFVLEKLRKGWS